MATENIGSSYNTQIPALTENADIQTALKIYHYGAATEPTPIIGNSIAGHFKNLEDTKIDIIPNQINSSTNLNSKVTTGYYSVPTDLIASSGTNFPPSATLGMLSVINDGSGLIYQTYLMSGTPSFKFFWRGYYAGAWTSWVQASASDHSHPEFNSLQGQINTKQATITGAASTIASQNLGAYKAVISNGDGKIAEDSNVTATEIGYLNNVSSNIQEQLDLKVDETNGSLTTPSLNTPTITDPTVTGTAVLPATTSIGTVTATEINRISGLSSSAQTQLNAKPTQVVGYKDTSTASIGGNATKKIIIASPNAANNAPNAAGYTASEGDIWFW